MKLLLFSPKKSHVSTVTADRCSLRGCGWLFRLELEQQQGQLKPAEMKMLQHIAASYINSPHMLYVVSSHYCKSKSLLFYLLTAGSDNRTHNYPYFHSYIKSSLITSYLTCWTERLRTFFFHGLLSAAGVYLFGFSESVWSLQAGLFILCLAGLDLSAVGSGYVASVMTIVTWWLLKCVCP